MDRKIEKLLLTFLIITKVFCITKYSLKTNGSCEDEDAISYIRKLEMDTLIIDLDAGSDDAFAVALPVFSKKRILAITTVNGLTNVDQAVNNTLRTLKVYKQKIPVYRGCQQPLLGWMPPNVTYYSSDGLADLPYEIDINLKTTQKEHAVLALIRLVNKHPNKITIVALGPLTNIALAILFDPNFLQKVYTLVWSGGTLNSDYVDFNGRMDPLANYIVFNNTKRPIIMSTSKATHLDQYRSFRWRVNAFKGESNVVRFLDDIEMPSVVKNKKWIASDQKAISITINSAVVDQARFFYVEGVYNGKNKGGFSIKKKKKVCNTVVVFDFNITSFYKVLENLSFDDKENTSKEEWR